jgi:ATP synthase protein I
MTQPDESQDAARKRLGADLDAFEASRASEDAALAKRVSGRVYRFLGEVVGGMLGGLGFGWLFDRIAHTSPFGLIGGLLIGVGVSTFVSVRGAGAWAKTESEAAGILPSVPDDDEQD